MTTCCKWLVGIAAAVVFVACVAHWGRHLTYCHVGAGFSVTLILSLLAGLLVEGVGETLRRVSQDPLIAAMWKEDQTRKKWGWLIGLFESTIFFASWLTPEAWVVGVGWLAFKVVLYWESTSFTKLPDDPPKNADLVSYVIDRQNLGAYHSTRLLVGTAASISAGLLGALVAQFLQQPFIGL